MTTTRKRPRRWLRQSIGVEFVEPRRRKISHKIDKNFHKDTYFSGKDRYRVKLSGNLDIILSASKALF